MSRSQCLEAQEGDRLRSSSPSVVEGNAESRLIQTLQDYANRLDNSSRPEFDLLVVDINDRVIANESMSMMSIVTVSAYKLMDYIVRHPEQREAVQEMNLGDWGTVRDLFVVGAKVKAETVESVISNVDGKYALLEALEESKSTFHFSIFLFCVMRAVLFFLLALPCFGVVEEKFNNGYSYYRNPKKPRKTPSYGVPTLNPTTSTEIGPTFDPTPQVDKTLITGIPDLSDPCFRRYANCIIVNAQPYERRSSTSLAGCKGHCLKSQIGVYSCRSFVYDNINQVCDLFAHAGDQTPARLMKFQSRDYFEPTVALACTPEPSTAPPATVPPSYAIAAVNKVLASSTDTRLSEPAVPANNVSNSDESLQTIDNAAVLDKMCGKGKSSRFLKTEGFELHAHDDEKLTGLSIDECVDACTDNRAGTKALKCKSFDYHNSTCILSSEAAVPLGNGQLKQRQGTDYFEKICVDERVSDECPMVFSRFPQMILVGFAETVTDAASFEQCFDNCLNSKKLFGFACSSGMYYFEEPQLNCILNTEDRTTQKDLFTEENSDIVDYFETGCGGSFMSARQRRFKSRVHGAKTLRLDSAEEGPKSERLTLRSTPEWTEWSECAPQSNRQGRRKICDGNRTCGRETRPCGTVDVENLSTEDLLKEARKAKCPPDVCCPAFGACQIGLLQNSKTRRLEWCRNPCRDGQLPKLL
ncbi:hypothetical protein QR680_014213 [Steinernema hermaphroditum]|uniref:Apple domain-containing protein n=1 Tax=Steinernema hermaphroditum TaxID=289476 RepID=A0AA39IAU2_9BILA|nr:hypothetical protein QR680_014213 [Steinernema hermaphroditum]